MSRRIDVESPVDAGYPVKALLSRRIDVESVVYLHAVNDHVVGRSARRPRVTKPQEGVKALNLNNVMLGSEDSKRLADFYAGVLGAPNPDWSDEANGWFGFRAGDGSLAIGPHSDVKGTNEQPGRIMLNFSTTDVDGEFKRIKSIGAEVVAEPYRPSGAAGMVMCTFADPDGNYFQLATPWNPETAQS